MDIKSFEHRICDIRFCRICAFSAFEKWKGWPIRDPVPSLPMIQGGKCPVCGGTDEVISANIAWLNIHGPYNTGLPDYWILKVSDRQTFESKFPSKWGLPYYELTKCERCGGALITSVFNSPIGWQLRHQCTRCNFTKTTEGR